VGSSDLWNYLHAQQVLKGLKLKFPSRGSKSEIHAKRRAIEKAIKENTTIIKIFEKFHKGKESDGKNSSDLEKDKNNFLESLAGSLIQTAGTLRINFGVELKFNDLDQYFQQSEFPPEVEEYQGALFGQVMSLSEAKSMWSWGAFWVAMFGILQIVAGVLLIYVSSGLLAGFGSTLIAEGCGDIFFAVETGLRKNFSWKAYAQHKAISLTISVICFGVGAYLAAGTHVAKATLGGIQVSNSTVSFNLYTTTHFY